MLKVARGAVVVSTVVAAFVETYFATQYHPYVFWTSVVGFLALLATGERVRRVALPMLMAAAYVMPAVFIATNEAKQADFGLDVVWVLPLLGLALSNGTLAWSLPSRWSRPLIWWSVLIAVVWPIIFLRETDFSLWVLTLERVSNTSRGGSPWEIGQNIAYFVLLHNAGILTVDALSRWYASDREGLFRDVLRPLVLAAALAAVVSFYQGFVDLGFLNQGFWTYMLRAPGTLGDPNKLGSVVAFWTIGAIAVALQLPRPWPLVVGACAIGGGSVAVWVCGSRTGLVAVGISVTIASFEAVRYWWRNRSRMRITGARAGAVVIGILVLVLGVVGALQKASTHTIVQRGTLGYVPFIGDRSIANSANELLWERFGYGLAAIEMVKEHPLSGIGPGMFHWLVIDYGRDAGYSGDRLLVSDNAQNWFRHNLAELGFIGMVPILWWCGVFIRQLFRRSDTGPSLVVALLRAVFIGFFSASIFGMPAQSIAIVMTFWVFALWFQLEHGPVDITVPAWPKPLAVACVALIALHAGSTTVEAMGSLRPLERARRWDWYYRYGWSGKDDIEADPGGNPVGRRWTLTKSLSLVAVQGRVLKFVAWVDHPDSVEHPVHTRIWADSTLVYEGELRRGIPVTLDITPRPGAKFVVIETEIDRTFHPKDFNPMSRDTRELGLSVRDWVWE